MAAGSFNNWFNRLFNNTAYKFEGIDFMELVPVPALKHEISETDGRIVLLVPRYTGPILGKILQPRLSSGKQFIRLPLDERGSWIWNQMNGTSTVGTMVEGFSGFFPEDSDQIPERLSGYLYSMWENNFVAFVNLRK